MPPSFFSPDTTWTGTQILLSEQHCLGEGAFLTPTRHHRERLISLALPTQPTLSDLTVGRD